MLSPTILSIPSPANGDPCGPAAQDDSNYPNTCTTIPALALAPSAYSINCTASYDVIKAPSLAVSWGNCSASINDTCTKMEDTRTLTGEWIETSLAEGCSLQFFLPPFQGSASRPTAERCIEIFTALNDTCATVVPPSNIGSINLKTIPGYDPSYFVGDNVGKGYPAADATFEGNAVNVGYPSYMIVGSNDDEH
ncbi:hypothetical protein P7C71_g1489, partial [Lecanoromycetidae sp. Uapishka_2]